MADNPFLEGVKTESQENPFLSGVNPKQQPKFKKRYQQGTFMDGVEAFNRQYGRLASGVLDLVTWGGVNEAVRASEERAEASYRAASERSPIATTVGAGAGLVGTAAATGGLVGGAVKMAAPRAAAALATKAAARPLAASAATGAAGGATLGALEYAPTMEERMQKGITGGMVGGLLGAAGYGAVKGAQAVGRYTKPRGKVAQDLAENIRLEGVTSGQQLKQMIPQGRQLTPGQVVGGKVRADELTAQASEVGRQAARKLDITQTDDSMSVIKKIINEIAPEGTKAAKKAAYKELDNLTVSDDVLTQLKSNPIIDDALSELKTGRKVTKATRGLPDNSVSKLDKVKQQIDDELFNDSRALDATKKMTSEQRAALEEARDEIVNTLDPLFGQYGEARALAQKLILQKRYQKLISKKGAKAGQRGELDVDDMWQSLFPTGESQQVFIQDVMKAGGNQESAQQMVTLLDRLRKSPLKRIWQRPASDTAGKVRYQQSKEGMINTILSKFTTERMSKAFLDLTFDPKWADEIAKILDEPVQKQPNAFIRLLHKAGKATPAAGGVGASRLNE